MLHRLEAADRPSELHPVLRVLDRHVERACRTPEHLGRGTGRSPIEQLIDGAGIAEAHRAGPGQVQPTQLTRLVERRLTCRTTQLRQIEREQRRPFRLCRNDDRHVGRGRIDDGPRPAVQLPAGSVVRGAHGIRARTPRDTAGALALQQAVDPLVLAGTLQRTEREDRREEGCRRDPAAHLLEEHRDLHRAEAEATARLGQLHRGPPLADHGLPELGVDAAAGVDHIPHAVHRRTSVEELARTLAQRELVVGELEIHPHRSLCPDPGTNGRRRAVAPLVRG